MNFDIVVAADTERGIARAGSLPWHLPGDLAHFRRVTTATRDRQKRNAVIMGRTTWDSIPAKYAPLPGRLNIVLTRNKDVTFPKGVVAAPSLEEALQFAEAQNDIEGVFVVGGANVYGQALAHPSLRSLYYTRISSCYDCTTFFPEFENKLKLEFIIGEGADGDTAYRMEVWRHG